MNRTARRISGLALSATMLIIASCGSGSETNDDSRNAAVQTNSPGKASWGINSTIVRDSTIKWDPVSKRSVARMGNGARFTEGLYTGAAGLIDVNDPWNDVVPASMPTINGDLNAVVSDGQGGWYLGGAFRGVGDTTFDAPRHVIRLDSAGKLTSFRVTLSQKASAMYSAQVDDMWLDETTGMLVVSTLGTDPPAHFTNTQALSHYASVRVLTPDLGNDVTSGYVPSVAGGFRIAHVANGTMYIRPTTQVSFGTTLDATNRKYLEAIDLRTRQFTAFGAKFHEQSCTVHGACQEVTQVLREGDRLVAQREVRRFAGEGGSGLLEEAWFSVSRDGSTSPVAKLTRYAGGPQTSWTVIGDRLFVSSCAPGDSSSVRAYNVADGTPVDATYTVDEGRSWCPNEWLVRIGDALYFSTESPTPAGYNGYALTKLDTDELKPVDNPFRRDVSTTSGGSTTEILNLGSNEFTYGGKSSTVEIPVSNGRAWWPTAWSGLYSRALDGGIMISDENGTQVRFDSGLAATNRRMGWAFDVHDGWLYALVFGVNNGVQGPFEIVRWNLTTLELDSTWSMPASADVTSIAVTDTAVVTWSFWASQVFTAYDKTTGFRRFSYSVPSATAGQRVQFVSEGDVAWVVGAFTSPEGQRAVARLDMTDGSVRLSSPEASWCSAQNHNCRTYQEQQRDSSLPLVSDADNLYTVVSGKLTRINKSTLESFTGPAVSLEVIKSGLAVIGSNLVGFDTSTRQMTRYSLPDLSPRGAIGPILQSTGGTANVSIVSGLVGTGTGLHFLLQFQSALGNNLVGSGAVAMSETGTISLGLRTAPAIDTPIAAMPEPEVIAGSDTSGQAVSAPESIDSIDPSTRLVDVVPTPVSEPSGRVRVTNASAGHRQIAFAFDSPYVGAAHRLVDARGKTLCTTTSTVCTVKNLSPSVAISVAVVPEGRPESTSEFTTALKPSYVMKKGKVVRTSSIVKPGKAKPTWSVRGGCRLNAAKTVLTAPKKAATCIMRVKGGKGKTAYNKQVRVVVR